MRIFPSIAFLAINASRPVNDGHLTQNKSFFDAVVFLTMFLMIGWLLEAYSKAKAGDAVGLLSKLRPTEAVLVDRDTKNGNSMVPIDQLEIGDVVRVANGTSLPYDGIVVEGESRFNESSLTGESKPVSKKASDEICLGTINQANPITMKLTRRSGDSMLDQIIDAVRQGQIRRAPIERVADAITGIFVPVITLIAILDWIIWLSFGVYGKLPEDWMDNNVGDWPFWSLQFAISVFVVACPCAIGIAAPTALEHPERQACIPRCLSLGRPRGLELSTFDSSKVRHVPYIILLADCSIINYRTLLVRVLACSR